MRRAPALATLATLLAASSLSPAAWADPAGGAALVQRDAVEVAPAKGIRIDLVDVDNRLGDVRVEGHDREAISILAVTRAPDQETMERLKVSLVPDPNGPVSITTALKAGREARPIPAGSVRIDLVVLVPRGARVHAQVWKGRVGVKGVDNGAELAADDGDIDVTEVSGAVTTESGHGRHTIAQVFGAVNAQSVQGDMDFDQVRGEELDAVVHEGDVIGRRLRVRNLSVRITRGNARLQAEAVPGGHYAVASYWGNVEIKFTGRTAIRVLARSRSGAVTLPPGFRRRSGTDGLVTAYSPGGGGRAPADLDLRTRIGFINVVLAEF
jgi:hypothetical protein